MTAIPWLLIPLAILTQALRLLWRDIKGHQPTRRSTP